MRHTFTIYKWEMKKIIGNWRKTLAVFLLPALLLLAAINVFPLLMNYLSTGHLQSRPITVVDAPESFRDYIDSSDKSSLYTITWMTREEAEELSEDEDETAKQMRNGRVFVVFEALEQTGSFSRTSMEEGFRDIDGDGHIYEEEILEEADSTWEEDGFILTYVDMDFDECVESLYSDLAEGINDHKYRTGMLIFYDGESYTSYMLAEQFRADLGNGYSGYLLSALGQKYIDAGGGSRWEQDAFNPFNFVLMNRANANAGAARSIPSMLILLMYYCIYSLSAETIASSRQSGFLTKVYLTPISKHALITGKALMVVTVGVVSAVVTYFLMFFSSWLNRSNSAYSMLPFGLFLTGSQLLTLFLTLLISAFLMGMVCFAIIFRLRRMEDVIMNLQVPLVLLIFEFFGNIFRPSSALSVEYLFPVHNSIMLIRDIFLGTCSWGRFWEVNLFNLLVAILLLFICLSSKDGMTHISQGGSYDFGKSRK
ncbi:MAG: ABC transporter permease [Clostridiales bacterium]|nr:ABC transporter permease [Clostridiales bacterium]